MIKSKNEFKDRPIEIDLTGPDGNAFALLGYARRFSKQLGKDTDDIQKRMMAGDYENLIKIFDEEFGHVVTLYR